MSEQGEETGTILKAITPILAIGGFLWGIYTYRDTSHQQMVQREDEAKRLAETRRVEASRAFLDRQLILFTEATKAATTIATSQDTNQVAAATTRFHELYWGELALVERGQVAGAMIAFRKALIQKENQEGLAGLALLLAHACRDELAVSWGTDAWKR